MNNGSRVELVRDLVERQLRELGADSSQEMSETLLIHDECYCGIRFEIRGHSAVWFVEEDELKFYGPSGRVAETIAPNIAAPSTPRAA